MSDLATYRARVALLLGDTTNTRYSTNLLDESIRHTLEMYSLTFPQVKTATITAGAGRTQTLTDITDMTQLLEINFPYDSSDQTPAIYTQPYYVYWCEGVPTLELSGNTIPASGDSIRLVYSAAHTIEDLDLADATTILDQHYTAFVNAAAGYAAQIRAQNMVETYGSKSGDVTRLDNFANQKLSQWEKFLHTLKHYPPPGPPVGQKGAGWKVDQWDTAAHDKPFDLDDTSWLR